MSAPRHILMTTDTVGGVWTYSMELARALASDGVRVSLATMGDPVSPAQRAEAEAVPGLRLVESSWKLEWMDDPWEDVDHSGEWLQDLASDIRPDLVHLNGYAHGALRWEVPAVVVAHSCVLSWWDGVHGNAAPAEWEEYRRRVRSGLHGADAVAAVSGAMASELQTHYGYGDAMPIYNASAFSGHRTSRKENFILTCGRVWDSAKNISALDEIADRVEWPVFAAGQTAHPDSGGKISLSKARALGKLTPADLQQFYDRAAIYALPARYEPFGLSILEAALSGCALVLGDIASLREIWRDAAIFVNPSSGNELADALNLLASNEALRVTMSRKALSRAEMYTPQRMLNGYRSLYTKAVEQFAARGVITCAS